MHIIPRLNNNYYFNFPKVLPPANEDSNVVRGYFHQTPYLSGSSSSMVKLKEYGAKVVKEVPLPYGKNEAWRYSDCLGR